MTRLTRAQARVMGKIGDRPDWAWFSASDGATLRALAARGLVEVRPAAADHFGRLAMTAYEARRNPNG